MVVENIASPIEQQPNRRIANLVVDRRAFALGIDEIAIAIREHWIRSEWTKALKNSALNAYRIIVLFVYYDIILFSEFLIALSILTELVTRPAYGPSCWQTRAHRAIMT
jgi:hypothetical protein